MLIYAGKMFLKLCIHELQHIWQFHCSSMSTDPPGCANGFVDMAALRYIMAATELTSHSMQEALRHTKIYFGCNGTIINKWTIGARITGDNVPQIHINDGFNKATNNIPLNSLNTTPYLNVYDYKLKSPVSVNEKQSISVESSQIYYLRCGLVRKPMQCIDQPLVAVSVSKFIQ